MRNILQSVMVIGLMVMTVTVLSSFGGEGEKTRIKVYIVNNCSQDVDFRVESPGSATKYTAYDDSKKPMTFLAGTKIYNSSGKVVHEISSSSEGKEIVVCE